MLKTAQSEAHMALSPIEEIIEDARNGRMFILVDDEDRENEGDLIIPAQMATPDAINFMAKYGRGLICLSLTAERVRQLELPLMSQNNGTRHETAFTVSIEAKEGVTTGISAADRARTIAVAIDPTKGKEHIVTPGHVFPLMAREGGVLVRAGHTEAAVDIARLAGLMPAGVICEIMNDDGTMARLPDLIAFAQLHGLKVGTIADLIAYRRRYDNLVECIAEGEMESEYGGTWKLKTYANKAEYAEHLVLIKGDIDPARPTLVRMHALSIFNDMLGEVSERTGQLQAAMRTIGKHGSGVIVIIRDTRPDRLSQIMNARASESREEHVLRDYGIGAQILVDLGVRDLVLLTRSARHNIIGLEGYGLQVVDEIELSDD
ncbi:3,4-dihydroxy-2-butanone-4-phosphate synthase [Pedomonas sp. V897]|uniref:3,4-dihydroxy-2-butanone-4-phosphate synthase n=1 Tax=Pedomonas sp. V897 TaxID=3446482 RepID=UPI003EE0031E